MLPLSLVLQLVTVLVEISVERFVKVSLFYDDDVINIVQLSSNLISGCDWSSSHNVVNVAFLKEGYITLPKPHDFVSDAISILQINLD